MLLSKNVKRTIKILIFASVFILLMLVFDAAFELDEGTTESMLTKYSGLSDIDTVFVGNSAGEMLDSQLYSEITGDNGFNMCTPSQGLSVSLKNIKLASSQHRINKVILLMTFDTANSENYDAIDHVYDRVVNSSSPLHKRIFYYLKQNIEKSFSFDVINTERSVNIWIPWENETIHGLPNICNNLKRRVSRILSGDRLGSKIQYDLNSVIYETVPDKLNKSDSELLQNDIDHISDLPIPSDMLAADKISLLARICSYCRNNNIDFIVVVTPHRTDYYDRYDSYREYNEVVNLYLNDFISKRGFMYYNTEEDETLHQQLPDEYFYDWEHVSKEYIEKSTDYLTGVIQKLEN